MSLLSTSQLSPARIQEVLKKELPRPAKLTEDPKSSIRQLLDNANLSPEEVLENLSSLMRTGETGTIQLGAAKVALELNGLLSKEQSGNNFNVVINILDSEHAEINPILFPR